MTQSIKISNLSNSEKKMVLKYREDKQAEAELLKDDRGRTIQCAGCDRDIKGDDWQKYGKDTLGRDTHYCHLCISGDNNVTCGTCYNLIKIGDPEFQIVIRKEDKNYHEGCVPHKDEFEYLLDIPMLLTNTKVGECQHCHGDQPVGSDITRVGGKDVHPECHANAWDAACKALDSHRPDLVRAVLRKAVGGERMKLTIKVESEHEESRLPRCSHGRIIRPGFASGDRCRQCDDSWADVR